ncbi:MAG: glycosyltransferase family 4 protein [Gemmatimonadetes bacterium]|nr:glycosyltransferase family 4 protein [Gemmatimonadota bacterium]
MADLLLVAPDLASGAVYTAHQFAGALSPTHRVRLLGPTTVQPWQPLRDELHLDGLLPGVNPFSRSVRRSFAQAARQADLVYAFKALPQSFGLALWARRRFGLRVALHLDDWDGGWFAGEGWVRRVWHAVRGVRRPNSELYVRALERMVERADVLTVSTRALQGRFGGQIVRQGVDTERVAPERFPRAAARQRIGAPEGRRLILFLGTPQPHKGIDDLIAAYRMLSPGSADLWVVGAPRDPSLAEAFAAMVRPGIELRPSVSFEEACWHIAAADVFVVPQRATPYAAHQLPAKLLQAMALGAPIVATDVGDAAEILGGEPAAGLLVPPRDPRALSAAIDRLLDEGERARVLGALARSRAQELYGWTAMARQLAVLLEPILPPVLGRGPGV